MRSADVAEQIKRSWVERVVRRELQDIRSKAQAFTQISFKNEALEKKITISMKGIKEWLNQPHREKIDKNRKLLDIGRIVEEAKYIGSLPDKHNPIVKAHLLETSHIGTQPSWIILREFPGESVVRIHSVTDSDTMKKLISEEKKR